MLSARDTWALASSTVFWMEALHRPGRRPVRSTSCAAGSGRLAVLGWPSPQLLGVERDEGGDERLVVADHHGLAHERVGLEASSSSAGCTFLPPAVMMRSFLRPVMREEAVVVERAEVAGVRTSRRCRRLGRGLVVAVSSR